MGGCPCRDCGGSQICVHGRRKVVCLQCFGTQICETPHIDFVDGCALKFVDPTGEIYERSVGARKSVCMGANVTTAKNVR